MLIIFAWMATHHYNPNVSIKKETASFERALSFKLWPEQKLMLSSIRNYFLVFYIKPSFPYQPVKSMVQ